MGASWLARGGLCDFQSICELGLGEASHPKMQLSLQENEQSQGQVINSKEGAFDTHPLLSHLTPACFIRSPATAKPLRAAFVISVCCSAGASFAFDRSLAFGGGSGLLILSVSDLGRGSNLSLLFLVGSGHNFA